MPVACKTTITIRCDECGHEHTEDVAGNGLEVEAMIRLIKRRDRWRKRRSGPLLCHQCDYKTNNPASWSAKIDTRSRVNVAEAVELYRSGATLDELGERYKVSRERVRQKIAPHITKAERSLAKSCEQCGCEFQTSNPRNRFCSSIECKKKRNRSPLDLCECGRFKHPDKPRCQRCSGLSSRTFDHAMAARLYEAGLIGRQVSKVMGVKKVTIFAALHRLGTPMRSQGSEPTMSDKQAAELYRKMLASNKEAV